MERRRGSDKPQVSTGLNGSEEIYALSALDVIDIVQSPSKVVLKGHPLSFSIGSVQDGCEINQTDLG